MFGLGPMEVAAVAAVGLLCFGTRLPAAARKVGRGLRGFKRGLAEAAAGDGAEAGDTATKREVAR